MLLLGTVFAKHDTMKKIDIIILPIFLLLLISCIPMKENKTTKAGLKMQEFVIGISKYARSFKPEFIIVPQNGAELAFNKLNPDAGPNQMYMDAVDGFGIEELFFTEDSKIDDYRVSMLRKLKANKKIMVSEFITQDDKTQSIIEKNKNESFIIFPRSSVNEAYREIPATITDENATDVLKLSDAKNYLYLINSSNFKNKFYFIKALAETNYDVLIVDLFFNKGPFTPEEVEKMKTKANGGKRIVLSYVNVGSAENFRYYWDGNWILNDPAWLKKKYEGYKDEYYVEFWNPEWQKIILGNDESYMKKVIDAGFDGAYLDNVEAYYFLYND